jgi:hypothetical protein
MLCSVRHATEGPFLWPASKGTYCTPNFGRGNDKLLTKFYIHTCLPCNNVVTRTRANLEISPPNTRDLDTRYPYSLASPSPRSCHRDYPPLHIAKRGSNSKACHSLSSRAQIPEIEAHNVLSLILFRFHALKYTGSDNHFITLHNSICVTY